MITLLNLYFDENEPVDNRERCSITPSQISVKLVHEEGMKFHAEMPDGRRLELNSGTSIGPAFSPMELFLVALAGCTGLDIQWIMDRQRQNVEKLEIQVRGTRREEDPKYYENVELNYTLAGPNIRKDAVERAIRLSLEKYCSVRAMLKEEVKVNTSYKIEAGTSAT